MISWDSPNDPHPCPYCGAADTRITLQLLGLVQCVCNGCRRWFAVKADGKRPASHEDERPSSFDRT